jgi:hypothetical protein
VVPLACQGWEARYQVFPSQAVDNDFFFDSECTLDGSSIPMRSFCALLAVKVVSVVLLAVWLAFF